MYRSTQPLSSLQPKMPSGFDYKHTDQLVDYRRSYQPPHHLDPRTRAPTAAPYQSGNMYGQASPFTSGAPFQVYDMPFRRRELRSTSFASGSATLSDALVLTDTACYTLNHSILLSPTRRAATLRQW